MAYIVLDKAKCKSCYLCIDACPKNLIVKSNETGSTGNFVVDFKDEDNECLGCKCCALTCPDLAITEVYK
ncbi:4Fe-4S binding protein [bacterium]|nr:4Fe-4S binding protein [bacterium]